MLDINKQEMKYSRQGEKVTIYDRDENGEIKYIEMDGERIPVFMKSSLADIWRNPLVQEFPKELLR